MAKNKKPIPSMANVRPTGAIRRHLVRFNGVEAISPPEKGKIPLIFRFSGDQLIDPVDVRHVSAAIHHGSEILVMPANCAGNHFTVNVAEPPGVVNAILREGQDLAPPEGMLPQIYSGGYVQRMGPMSASDVMNSAQEEKDKDAVKVVAEGVEAPPEEAVATEQTEEEQVNATDEGGSAEAEGDPGDGETPVEEEKPSE